MKASRIGASADFGQKAISGILAEAGLRLEERAFTVAEARTAREAFITAASTFVMPVVAIDGAMIGDGRPGPVTRRLVEAYAGYAASGGRAR